MPLYLNGQEAIIGNQATIGGIPIPGVYTAQGEPTGFPNRTDTTIAFDDGTRTLTVGVVGSTFDFYIDGVRKTVNSNLTKQITDTEGLWFFYIDSASVLQATQTFSISILQDNAYVAVIYWDATNDKAIYFGDERHGMNMDSESHLHFHESFGAQFITGLGLANFDIDGNGNDETAAKFSVADGVIRDEDIRISITDDNPQDLANVAEIPVYYLEGATPVWRKQAATQAPIINASGGANRAAYNEDSGGTWGQTEVANNSFVLAHIFATNDVNNPIISVQGQNEYGNIGDARTGAEVEITTIYTVGLPFAEFTRVATVIYQTSTGYSNTWKSRTRTTDEGDDYIDWRDVPISGMGQTANDHGALSGLLDDDHTQYLLADGSRELSADWDVGSYKLTMAELVVDTTAGITNEGPIWMKEAAAAQADVASYGQIWIKNTTPNELWFTDDAGNDYLIQPGGAPGAHDHDGDTLQADGIDSDGGAFSFTTSGAVTFSNTVALSTVVNAGVDTDKFLVLDGSDNVDFRTGAEVLSDIGAAASAHTHDGDTLQLDGINSDGGAFSFTTTGAITMSQGSLNLGVQGTTPGLMTLYGEVAPGTDQGGKILLNIADGWNGVRTHYGIQAFEGDFYIGPSTFISSMLYLGASQVWRFQEGKVQVGSNDSTPGEFDIFGGSNTEAGGRARIYTASDQDTDVDYFQLAILAGTDDLIIGPDTDPDLIKIVGHATTPQFTITANGMDVTGTVTLQTVVNAGVDTDKFLVLDGSNNVDFRTGAEVASDIGALTSLPAHDHDGDTLQLDGINSDGGAFTFATTGAVSFTQGNVYIGDEDTLAGTLICYGHATGSTQGGKVVLETADDHDGTFNSVQMEMSSAYFQLGPDTDTDLLTLQLNPSDVLLSTFWWKGSTMAIGTPDGDYNTQLTLYGEKAGSADGGQINIHPAADHDGSFTHFVIKANEDDLWFGPATDSDALKYDGGTGQWQITAGGLAITGTAILNTVVNAGTDTDKFLVLDGSNNVDFRTGAEVLSDIGAAASAHTHDGDTLQLDGINSDGGAFTFATTGDITINQGLVLQAQKRIFADDSGGTPRNLIGTGSSEEVIIGNTNLGNLEFNASGGSIATTVGNTQWVFGSSALVWALSGDLRVGNDNSIPSIIYAYGGGAGELGGELRAYNAADHDDTVDYYVFKSNVEDLNIGPDTNEDALAYSATDGYWTIDVDFNMNSQSFIMSPLAGGADETGSGDITDIQTVDVNALGFGAVLFMASDGNYETTDADAAATMPGVALALEAGTGVKKVLLRGFVRDDTWNWTPGGLLYVQTDTAGNPGEMTQTQPSGSGDQVQCVGYATHADRIFFNPMYVIVEIA